MAWQRALKANLGSRGLALLCLIVLLGVRAWDPPVLQSVRALSYDAYQNLAPRPASGESAVTVINIDERSLARYGQWPWPRSRLAEMVEQLRAAGTRAIGFDILFADADRLSASGLREAFSDLSPEARRAIEALPDTDAVFASAIEKAPVVLSVAADDEADADSGPVQVPYSFAHMGPDPKQFVPQAPGTVRTVPALRQAAKGLGSVTIFPAFDNVVRKVPLLATFGETLYPTLALELLRVATGEQTYVTKGGPNGLYSLVLAGQTIPTDRDGAFWIHFSSRDTTRYISAADILDGSFDPAAVRGRIALVGTSAAGLRDIKAVPVIGPVPGVSVHAQAIDNILSGDYLQRPRYGDAIELLTTLAAGLLLIVAVPLLGPVKSFLIGGVTAGGIAGTSFYLFQSEQLLLDSAYPCIASLGIYALLAGASYLRDERQKRFVRDTFKRYLAPAMVDRLAEQPEALRLGGETREVTVFFSDIQGFTQIAEQYGTDAQGLTHLINSALSPVSEAVLHHGGTIDKYIGDAVMAFWNAPLDVPDHELRACRAALDAIRAVDGLNRKLAAEQGESTLAVRFGIGMNTGAAVVGNLGTDLHMNYSVIGDTVNVAARLESLTRTYDVPVVIGETTARAVGDTLAVLQLDYAQVKGRDEPVTLYALLGDETMRASGSFQALAAVHETMLACYNRGDWAGAYRALERGRPDAEALGLRRVYDIYADRLDELLELSEAPAST